MRQPAKGDAFEWRVSIAHIEASGPFSDFAGYDRKMVLLKGEGVELDFADGSRSSLRCVGDLTEFDGALPVQCTLRGGPCVDLNLMVAKGRVAKVGVQRLTAAQEITAGASSSESTLILGIDDALAVTIEARDEHHILQPWDLAVISNGVVRLSPQESSACSNGSAVFFATINH